ncbi:hypothetical protein Daura_41355 [Dactylosporangium aurantiacum]|uniref:Uncharacterized protein n=1 Tax=Dactylosporangium aurantiacum TaxID=35754 RepID=A0A9Q9ICZ3_9ACTN|nr:hypothetical protein [Dactylosporangium aurantiacum]MDG6102772.1 hypothetical protein [Dactylosporangium aurantiacum]UWZ52986.1 hypothetical protein Daura_41355 [Dactylosporangium aurantiacum]
MEPPTALPGGVVGPVTRLHTAWAIASPLRSRAAPSTVTYGNLVVATSAQTLSAAESRYRDTPILDSIDEVRTDTVAAGLGTARPVLSIAARGRRAHRRRLLHLEPPSRAAGRAGLPVTP